MKVLVWKGYGCTDVYKADNEEDFEKIKRMVIDAIDHYDSRERLHKTRRITEVRNWVEYNTNGDDAFEQFELIEVQ